LLIKLLLQLKNADCLADSAVSYRSVLRRVLPNGQTIESEPSSPVFAYNPTVIGFWTTDNATYDANQIIVAFPHVGATSSAFTVNQEFTGSIVQAQSWVLGASVGDIKEVVDSPEINGRFTFKVISSTFTSPYEFTEFLVTLDQTPKTDKRTGGTFQGDSVGILQFALDRFSDIEIKVPDSAQAGDFIDIYYSKTETPLSASPIAVPDGDYYLAKEIELTGAAPYSVTTDFSDGIFQKGPPLYTNPSDGDRSKLPKRGATRCKLH